MKIQINEEAIKDIQEQREGAPNYPYVRLDITGYG